MGNLLNVHRNDDDGQHHVADGHDRHQHGTDVGYTLDAAKDDEQPQLRQASSYNQGRPSECLLHGATDGVGLNRVVRETELQRDEYCKRHGEPSLVQTTLDVVGRTTDERVAVVLFE